jgi:hypothetical protein
LPEKYELLEKRGYTYGAHCKLLENEKLEIKPAIFTSGKI